jgi:hypothetical protein
VSTIPVRKPPKQLFVRAHPSEAYRLTTAVIDMQEEGEIYLISSALRDVLATETALVTLFTAVNRDGKVFLRTVKWPKEDSRTQSWHTSALAAVEIATKAWVCVQWNGKFRAYAVSQAAPNPDPEWPDLTLQEILKIAFRERYVDTLDRPVIAKLRGLIL